MELAEAKVAKTRAAHEKAVGELKKLYDIRKEQQQEQLLKAMMSGKRSFEEILKSISDDTAFQCGSIFCFLKVMTMNHAHSSVRTQRSAYRA